MPATPDVAIDVQIHHVMESLTAAEKRVARALLANYPTLGLGPVADFGQAAGASAATVLRFIARLGFESYPEFQRDLRDELQQRMKAPPVRIEGRLTSKRFLDVFSHDLADSIRNTAARIPASEFEEICVRLSNGRMPVHLVGGRFTDSIASYLNVHLALIRPWVRMLEPRAITRVDQLVDIRQGDTVIIFDVPEYDAELTHTARLLAGKGVCTILFTDAAISPVSRYAKYVLPCEADIGQSWAVNTALFALTEAVICRTSELAGAKGRSRISTIELLRQEHG